MTTIQKFEVLKFNISDNLELLIVELDDIDATINISIENTCNAMLEAGLINDYDLEDEAVAVDFYDMESINYQEVLKTDWSNIFDHINDLKLDDVKTIVEVFFKNNCYTS